MEATVEARLAARVAASVVAATVAQPATIGCGATTFDVTVANSASAMATATFTAATALMESGTKCSLEVATGVTTAPMPQVANWDQRTVSVVLASVADFPAVGIEVSTALNAPAVQTSSLLLANAVVSTATAVTFKFVLNAAVHTSEIII